MTFNVALRLGRVSNLPTVWTNMLAAVVLAGGIVTDLRLVPVALALSLFYIGGMFLNDAFDAEIDARERPERPIPSGQVSKTAVFTWGFAMLAAGIGLLLVAGMVLAGGTGIWPALGGLGLALAIIAYNRHHKGNPSSPLIMGLCRVFVYLTAGLCFVVTLPPALFIGAGLLLAYLIGLTYVAKQENLGRVENMWPLLFLGAPIVFGALQAIEQPAVWPFWAVFTVWILVALYFVKRRGPGDIPRAVVSLIAGICLLDAVLIANAGEPMLAGLAVVGFVLTLFFQKFIAGT
ncbi:MAG: UbiA family prenyltransferase [Rhodospirillales bacterium]|nr:UbiA family prenyltransferase [Rhodospirillales bacterium]